jgi:pimeloyl-ACP methyl ester carboxylesterase
MKRWLRVTLIVLAALVVLLGVAPLVIPIPPLKGTLPVEQLADADSRFFTWQGLQVHYKQVGQGEPAILLLHGFGASLYSWNEVLEPLSALGTVVAYDRPAFGLTSRPMPGDWQGDNPYSPEAQVALTVALLDALDLERAVLVGHSAGGAVAALVALRHPERVAALVLVDAAIYEGGVRPWLRPLLRTPQMRRLGPLFSRSIATFGERALSSAWADPTRISAEARELYRKPLKMANWDRALWEFTLASEALPIAERLDQLTMPVLVMSGDQDRIVPPESSLRLAEALGVTPVVIANAGHLPHEEQPERFLQAVTPFVAALP